MFNYVTVLCHFFCYRFDTNWLKEEFQTVDQIDSNTSLSSKGRKYLKIIHGDEYLKAMAPSRSDRLALKEAYGKVATCLLHYHNIRMCFSQSKYSRSLQNLESL